MRITLQFALILVFFGFFLIQPGKAQAPSFAADGVIVEFLDSPRIAQDLTRERSPLVSDDFSIVDHVQDMNLALVQDATNSQSIGEMIDILEQNPLVSRVEPNLKRTFSYIPNDTLFSNQWAHRNIGQSVNGTSGTNGADMDSAIAWDNESSITPEITVAVIDTGVEYTHPDFSGNMWDGSSACKDDFNLDITGGCPHHGWNYENSNNNPIDTGQSNPSYAGHGTFAASVIGATAGNGQGISGTSRYNKLKIMALRFNFDVFSEIKAINFARYNGAKVINASYGGGGFSQIESDAIASFPGIMVAAAGNGGSDFVGDNNDASGFYPCNYNVPNMICVAATGQTDLISTFSNYGTTNVDIAAPGVNISGIYRGSYLFGNGTSFAAPFVSAAVGLAYAHNPTLTDNQIKDVVLNNAEFNSNLTGLVAGSRKLNIANVLGIQVPPVPETGDSNQQFTFRFYSPVFQGHFYTTNVAERNSLITTNPDWTYEGIAFKTYKSAISTDIKPIYRFYSSLFQGHFYTISETEKNDLSLNNPAWAYEGVSYYAQNVPGADVKPLYRFFSPLYKHHFYTTIVGERDDLIQNNPNWNYEGIAFYLPK